MLLFISPLYILHSSQKKLSRKHILGFPKRYSHRKPMTCIVITAAIPLKLKNQCDWNEQDIVEGDLITYFIVICSESIKHNDRDIILVRKTNIIKHIGLHHKLIWLWYKLNINSKFVSRQSLHFIRWTVVNHDADLRNLIINKIFAILPKSKLIFLLITGISAYYHS